ncbi:MAG: AraC family transcriptional regulator [Clostridia bacterium]|nr:AraC family transcriptional regulator [Clostridia bacterium]
MLRIAKTNYDAKKNIVYGDISYEELNYFTYDNSKEYPIRIESIGITHPNKKYFIERQHSDYFVLEYIKSGKGYIICDDKKYTVEENDVYLIHLGSKHRYGADSHEPYEKIWVNFFGGIFTDIISAYGLSGRVVFKNTSCKELFEELLDLAINYNDNEEVYLNASEIIFKIILKLVENTEKQNISAVAIKTKETLDQLIYRKVTMQDVYDEIHLSKSQISREFKKYYGVTPYQYLLNRRIAIAQNLLTKTKLSIKEISDSLCFVDEYHFSSLFKKRNGVSPTAYRKAHRQ